MGHLTDTEKKARQLVRDMAAGRGREHLGKRSEQLVRKVVYENRHLRAYDQGAFFRINDPTGASALVSVKFCGSTAEAEALRDHIMDFFGDAEDE